MEVYLYKINFRFLKGSINYIIIFTYMCIIAKLL